MTKKKTSDRTDSDQKGREMFARNFIHPASANLTALNTLHECADPKTMAEELATETKKVLEGDLSFAEMMLIDQAQVLQSIFVNMTIRMESAEYMSQMEAYGRMALRAQNQCNRTLKTLLEYKNPKRATFIKQQNNLQINQAEKNSEKEVQANELLEENRDARLDTGTAQEAIGSHTEVEAVAEVHGAKD